PPPCSICHALSPCFSFDAPPTPCIYTLSLHDALPISIASRAWSSSFASSLPYASDASNEQVWTRNSSTFALRNSSTSSSALGVSDRKSTRLNSSHQIISYAVFCLKKKTKN